ncbi:hypothetical protein MJC1_01059 [Methylocystis sp. MJC1]|jgi:hypothetical protein|nr:hypothetical protein MJC1_01059 [Methylocystis sp. MJC1]
MAGLVPATHAKGHSLPTDRIGSALQTYPSDVPVG